MIPALADGDRTIAATLATALGGGEVRREGAREWVLALFAKLVAAQGAVVRHAELCTRGGPDAEPTRRATAGKSIRRLQ